MRAHAGLPPLPEGAVTPGESLWRFSSSIGARRVTSYADELLVRGCTDGVRNL